MDVTPNLKSQDKSYPRLSKSGPKRTNIYILFAEFSSSETSALISYLHLNHFAPRGKNITQIEEINQAVAERSWDLILCKSQQHSFDPLCVAKKLHNLGKDIPILQLVEQPTQAESTRALLNGIQAVLPLFDKELLLLHISREYNHLQSRRLLRLMQLRLCENQKRCKILMDNSALAMCFINKQNIVYLNDSFCQLFGYKIAAQLLNKSVLNLIAYEEQAGFSDLLTSFLGAPKPHLSYQLLAKRSDKSNFTAHIELQQALFNDDTCIEMVVAANQHSKSGQKFAEMDAITGLYNFDYFTDILEVNLRRAFDGGNDTHLLYIQIANFANVRAQLGTEASRNLARDVADILNQEFSKTHIKARLSDNVFAIIYADPDTLKVKKIADSLNARFNQYQCNFNQESIQVQSAMAIVPITDTISNARQAYDYALECLLECSNIDAFQERVVVYTPLLSVLADEQLQSIEQVRFAIADRRLRLLFQPIVPLVYNSKEQHYEVLLRMVGDKNQNIPPASFLASVKHANLNESMDKWVIEHSIKQFSKVEGKHNKLKIFISVTDTVWERERLLMWLCDVLRASRVQADQIVIQISETETSNSLSKAKIFVDGLRQLNCLICLKHYGSTSESKTVLKALDPDFVKFDGSFIEQLSSDAATDPLFDELLGYADSLGKIMIATQVESPKAMSLLWKHGVGMVQGYYLQAPQEAMDYEF